METVENPLKELLTLLYLIGYNSVMYLIKQTDLFSKWLTKLKDIKGKVAVLRRIDRVKMVILGIISLLVQK